MSERQPVEPAARHLLVVANRTCPCSELLQTVRGRAAPGAHTLIVAPALNRRLAHWVSDTDGAVRAARGRVEAAVEALRATGLAAGGRVGDADPFVAIADTLVEFPAEEIIVSSWPRGRSHWLEKGLLRRVRAEYPLPVHHVVSAYGLGEDAHDAPPLMALA